MKPQRYRFIVPTATFWDIVRPHAQPFVRLGISMASLVQLAGHSLGLFNQITNLHQQVPGYTPVAAGVHYLETIRSYVSHELANVCPDLLWERGDFDLVTYQLVDVIHVIRSHLCEYISLHIGVADPTLQLESFLGPELDLVMSYQLPAESSHHAPDLTPGVDRVQAAFHHAAATAYTH
jgi:hypothetical protein